MEFPDVLDDLPVERVLRRVYGEPYVTPDGATVIPVARIKQTRPRRRGAAPAGDAAAPYDVAGEPLGVFVISGDQANWVPAVDNNRVALVGVATGFVAALIGTLAVLRRPPWPDLRVTDYR